MGLVVALFLNRFQDEDDGVSQSPALFFTVFTSQGQPVEGVTKKKAPLGGSSHLVCRFFHPSYKWINPRKIPQTYTKITGDLLPTYDSWDDPPGKGVPQDVARRCTTLHDVARRVARRCTGFAP